MKKHLISFLFLILLLNLSMQAGAVTGSVSDEPPEKRALIPIEVIRNTKDLIVSQTEDGKSSCYLSVDEAGRLYYYDPVRNLYVYNGRRQEVNVKGLDAYGWSFSKNLRDTLHGSTPGASKQTGYEQVVLMRNLAQIYDFYEEVLGLDGFNGCGGALYAVADAYFSDKDFHNEINSSTGEWIIKVLERTVLDYDQGYSYMEVPETALTVFYAGTNKLYGNDLESWESRAFVAHEYTHAVFKASLHAGIYGSRSRDDDKKEKEADMPTVLDAVEESYADIFSQLVNAYYEEDDPSWIFADDVGINRNMKKKKGSCVFHVNDYKNSEAHDASTILSHAMYFTWNEWRSQSLTIDECVRDMAYLLYAVLGEIPSDCTFDTLGRLFGGAASNMKIEGRLNQDQINGLREGLGAVGISYYDTASNSLKLHSDYELWKRCLTETVVSVMEIGQKEHTLWELNPQSRELAMARMAGIYGRDQSDFYDGHNEKTGEGSEYWEKKDDVIHISSFTFFMYESWLFGNNTLVNDLAVNDPKALRCFKNVSEKGNDGEEILLPLSSVKTARASGWACSIHSIQRNRDIITLEGVIKNKETEKEFYATFERNPFHLDGAFFYGFHLNEVRVFDQTLDEKNIFKTKRITLPISEEAPGETDSKDDLVAYVTKTLIPERGQPGPDPMFTNVDAMFPISEWKSDDLDGILGWVVADFDADGTEELLVTDLHEGQTLELIIYEPGEAAGPKAVMKDAMIFPIPLSYLTLSDLQTNCFYYNQKKGRPVIAIDCHYNVMENVSTLLLYQYNGTGFEFCHGFGYHETGEGDVYLYDAQEEPASIYALNSASSLSQKNTGWELKKRYIAEEHDWTGLSKEEEKKDFYVPYEQSASSFGLTVNDMRLWVLQDDWDSGGDYDEYYNKYAKVWTADVYAPSDMTTGESLTFVGGIDLFYIMNGQSYLQFVS